MTQPQPTWQSSQPLQTQHQLYSLTADLEKEKAMATEILKNLSNIVELNKLVDEQKQLIIENENLMKEDLREHKRVNTIKQEISQLQSSFPQDKQNRLDTMFELVRFSDPNTENNLF